MEIDLLHPTAEHEKSVHKLKRLVQSPNSYFLDVKCPGCLQITTVFSHAQTTVLCGKYVYCSMPYIFLSLAATRLSADQLVERPRFPRDALSEERLIRIQQ